MQAVAQQMKSWRVSAFGDITSLRLVEADAPSPAPGNVVLRVRACGINFADTLMIAGKYQSLPELPFAPGMEVAGVVERVGEGVSASLTGAHVLAYCGHGGLSEFVEVPAALCVPVPDNVDDATAAGVLVTYGSAEIALARRARLAAGEWLAVLGAGGGVGLTGVEIGRLLGARVLGFARGEAKLAAARRAGAEHVEDLSGHDFSTPALRDHLRDLTGGHGVDVLYDPVGGDLSRAASRAMAFEGRILPLGFASGGVPEYKANHLLVKNINVIGFWWGAYFAKAPEVVARSTARILDWLAAGEIAPFISNRVPFTDAPDALTLLAGRAAAGKVVVVMPQ